jgi:predicted nucleic acid-binding protein
LSHFVLDASVALAWFLDHPVPNYAVQVRDVLLKGSRAIVPALWHLEIANGLAIAERRQIISATDASQGLKDVEQLVIHALDTDGKIVPVRRALTIARAYQLSAYDAAYLNLASEENLPLATLEQSLRRAASRAGVQLLS